MAKRKRKSPSGMTYDKDWERQYEAELRRAKKSRAWRSQSTLIKARKSHGLRGTSSEHHAKFDQETRIARKPVSFGCSAAQRAWGAAKAHYQEAPTVRRRELLAEADDIIGAKCFCKLG